MAEVDELYSVKTAYWLGNYEEAIQEARAARVKSEPLKVERDVYAHRAAIALGQYASVIDGVRDDEPVPLQAVKLLASYLSSPPKGREVALLQLEDWLADASAAANTTLQFVAGSIYLHQGDLAAALTAVKGGGTNLETLGLAVQVYLRMDRADLAEKAVKAMAGLDDESALTQLCTGLTCLAQGGDKAREASLIFKELSDRAGSDPLPLVNGLAAAYMSQRRWEDAEKLLSEAHARAPGDVDTLVNLAACAAQAGRAGEAGSKWLPLLREAAAPGDGGVPNASAGHVAQLELAEGMFDRVAASYAISQQ